MGYIEQLRELVGHRPLILVGAVVIMLDEHDRVWLQQRKTPEGIWGLPGGLMELGESVEDTARREVLEETGLRVGELQLLGVWSGPQQFVRASNGDEFYVVTTAFYTRDVAGELVVDPKESLAFRRYSLNELPQMVRSHRAMLDRYIERVHERHSGLSER